MIAASRSAKALAVSAAALLHGAALWGLSTSQEVQIEGGSAAAEVALGSSFADMAAGTLTPEAVPDVTEFLEPTKADTIEHIELVEAVSTDRPVIAKAPETAQPNDFAEKFEPVEPIKAQPLEAVQAAPLPTEAIQLDPAETVTPAETLTSDSGATTAVVRSLRPKTRSESFEKKNVAKPAKRVTKAEAPKTTAKKKKANAQPAGNARQNANAGSATGSTETTTRSASSGTTKKKKAEGNAAASNYPGKVMRKIARVPKPRVGKKGSAVVAFTISANGGLASISLARSSGSGQLDKAALRVVRKAAPFPPPPAGARRSFSIKIKGG